MKKTILLLTFIGFIGNSFWLYLNLKVNPTQSSLNQPLTLDLTIKSDKPVTIQQIQWLDSFDIVWTSEFHSSQANIEIVNWKINQKIVQVLHQIYQLQPKKPWTYTIWPAIVKIGNQTYKTNSVKVNILWNLNTTSQSISQNNLNQQNIPTKNQNFVNQNNNLNTLSQPKENNQPIKAIKPITQNYEFIFMILAIIFTIWIIITMYAIKNKEEKTQNNRNKQSSTENSIISTFENTSTKQNHPLSFLEEKYWIKDFQIKTYSEIINELNDKNIQLSPEEQEILEKNLLNKYKPID